MSSATVLPPPVPEHDGLHGTARTVAMFAVALSVLLSVLDYAVANVALPTIAADIHTTASSSIWVLNAYQLASVISLLPLAAVGDIIGYARLCRIGLGVFVLASILCAGSHTLLELALSRALQGFGGACIMSVNAALIRHIYPRAVLGRGIALNGLVVASGVALGPTIAAGVLAVATWPWLFLINLPLGGAAIAASWRSLPAVRGARTVLDWRSAILILLSFGALIVGLDRMAHDDPWLPSVGLTVAGALALATLVRRQLTQDDPMLPVDLLRLRGFRAAALTGFLGFVASNFFIISMPFSLEGRFGFGPVRTGLLITPWPLAIVASAPIVGRLADRYPAAILSSVGLLMTASGFALLRLLPPHPAAADIAWRIALAGAGFGLFQPPNNRAMLVTAPSGRTGSASGMLSVTRLLGQTIGAMLVAMVFAVRGPRATVDCLLLASLTGLLAAGVSASRWKRAGG